MHHENASQAQIAFEVRPSDSPYIERVWRSRSDRGGLFHSMAGSHWGMVVSRVQGKLSITVRGPETRATTAECPPEGEWVGVLFKLGTFMPFLRSGELRDRQDRTLPNATTRSFWLQGSAWDFPGFETMETFVARCVRGGWIGRDDIATTAVRRESQGVSLRTEQRRVREVTGLTCSAIHQIERARRATLRLRAGRPILDVVHELGYFDQAHLTRSLKRLIGETPARLAQGHGQLSLLYNP